MEAIDIQAAHRDIQIGQIARHYKGGLYRIQDKVTLEAGNEPALVYTPLDRTLPSVRWTRATALFFEEVSDLPRFTFSPLQSEEGLRAAIPEYLMSAEAVESVLKRYDSADRYYHDRQHVLGMFNRALQDDVVLTPEQALAILFHDAVYAPGVTKGYNESSSCKVLRLYTPAIRGSQVNLDFVSNIIMDTVEHNPTFPESPVVLDLDLIGLAGSFEEFKTNWELNRLECAHLVVGEENPRDAFDSARLKLLIKMCHTPQLFKSKHYKGELNEIQFRANVEAMRQAYAESRQP